MFGFLIPLAGLGLLFWPRKNAAGQSTNIVKEVFGPFLPYGPFLPENYILKLIRTVESNNDYNSVFGGGNFTLTNMTVNQIVQFQSQRINQGYKSSALGAYQFIQKTMLEMIQALGLSGAEKFDVAMQDRMATYLLNKRGFKSYLSGAISQTKFMLNLSMEWAALPKDGSGQSYYHGDGLNKALVSPQQVAQALQQTKNAYT